MIEEKLKYIPNRVSSYCYVDRNEYEILKKQVNTLNKISHELFDAYYGKDYYIPDSCSNLDAYCWLAKDLIEKLNKEREKKNIFKRIWQKITKW